MGGRSVRSMWMWVQRFAWGNYRGHGCCKLYPTGDAGLTLGEFRTLPGALCSGWHLKQQLDQLRTQLEVAETALKNLGENTTLVSPINGVVTARNYDPGDVAMQLPILTIENINPVKVVVNVSESYYSRVQLGMPVEVTVDALGSETFTGKVSLIHPTFDPVSHTFTVEISVANSDMRLRPGMYARVKMNFVPSNGPLSPIWRC